MLGPLALLLAGAAAWLVLTKPTEVKETAELAVSGGERQLRDPMRALDSGPRVLLFALDGVGVDEFRRTVREAKGGHIQTLLGQEAERGEYTHAYAVPGALSTLPSTTVAAWSSLYTGEPPARTGVPGNEWFARDEVRFYAPAPVSVDSKVDTLRMLTDGLVSDAVKTPTLYEKADVRAFVSLAQVYRGADLFTTPEPTDVADLAGEFAKGLVDEEQDVHREVFSEVDEESVDSVLEALGRHGIPRLQVVYFPGVDLYSHVARHALDEQRRYVREVLDPLVGRVLDAYAKQGVLEDTHVLFVSDHGHTPVLGDDLHALSADGDDEPTALLARQGFRLRPAKLELEKDEQDFQAVVAYQGAMAYVYLADRSTCPEKGQRCDWKRPPRFQEDVLPVVRAFHEATNRGTGVVRMKGARWTSSSPGRAVPSGRTRCPSRSSTASGWCPCASTSRPIPDRTCCASPSGWTGWARVPGETGPETCCCWRAPGWKGPSSSASTSPVGTAPGTAAPATRTASSPSSSHAGERRAGSSRNGCAPWWARAPPTWTSPRSCWNYCVSRNLGGLAQAAVLEYVRCGGQQEGTDLAHASLSRALHPPGSDRCTSKCPAALGSRRPPAFCSHSPALAPLTSSPGTAWAQFRMRLAHGIPTGLFVEEHTCRRTKVALLAKSLG